LLPAVVEDSETTINFDVVSENSEVLGAV